MPSIPDVVLKIEVDTSELEKAIAQIKQAVEEASVRAIVADEVRKQLEARDNEALKRFREDMQVGDASQG